MEAAYTNAAKKAHPDRGGDQTQMASINVAKQVLREHHGGQQ
jgi:DnaJ-class molecular chaperone